MAHNPHCFAMRWVKFHNVVVHTMAGCIWSFTTWQFTLWRAVVGSITCACTCMVIVSFCNGRSALWHGMALHWWGITPELECSENCWNNPEKLSTCPRIVSVSKPPWQIPWRNYVISHHSNCYFRIGIFLFSLIDSMTLAWLIHDTMVPTVPKSGVLFCCQLTKPNDSVAESLKRNEANMIHSLWNIRGNITILKR